MKPISDGSPRKKHTSRLARAKHKLRDLLALRKGSATGLIVYSGSAHLVMPLTRDDRIVSAMVEDPGAHAGGWRRPGRCPAQGRDPAGAGGGTRLCPGAGRRRRPGASRGRGSCRAIAPGPVPGAERPRRPGGCGAGAPRGNAWFSRIADQRGYRSFERTDYASAASQFADPMWRAVALYREGELEQAASLFAGFDTAEAVFNQGNALVMQGKYEAAVERYDRALALRPGWEDASGAPRRSRG